MIGLMKSDPDERLPTRRLQFVNLVQRGGEGVLAGEPTAVGIDRSIDHGLRNREPNLFRLNRRISYQIHAEQFGRARWELRHGRPLLRGTVDKGLPENGTPNRTAVGQTPLSLRIGRVP
jgi:hypothetical protein